MTTPHEQEWRVRYEKLLYAHERLHDRIEVLTRQLAEAQLTINGWRELGEEMGRILSCMSPEQAEDLLPDWFGPRLFDMQVGTSVLKICQDCNTRWSGWNTPDFCPRCEGVGIVTPWEKALEAKK